MESSTDRARSVFGNDILWQLVVVVLKLVVAAASRVEACVLVEDNEHAAVVLEP